MFIDPFVMAGIAIAYLLFALIVLVDNIKSKKRLKQSLAEFQDYFTETSGTIVLKQNEIDALKKKSASQEVLDMLKDLNDQGALLSITRVNQDNIYFHTGR